MNPRRVQLGGAARHAGRNIVNACEAGKVKTYYLRLQPHRKEGREMEELKKALKALDNAIKCNDTIKNVRITITFQNPKANKANPEN